MASKTSEGNFILSASEVGSFTVCAEAWRLKEVQRIRPERNKRSGEGENLHSQWAKSQDELLYLLHRVRFVLWLLAGASLVFIIKV